MKCNNCSTTFVPAKTSAPIRCLNCGVLLNGLRPAAPNPAKPSVAWEYTTPFTKLIVQVQSDTSMLAIASITATGEHADTAAVLIGNLLESWNHLDHHGLARSPWFNPSERPPKCSWTLSNSQELRPLASFQEPRPSAEVIALIAALEGPLRELHRYGLGAWDLSPSCVFVDSNGKRVTLVPTPWLAAVTSWAPQQVKQMPFVAPELERYPNVSPDPVRADIYALGAIAWYLLTGRERKGSEGQLPGDFAPGFASWNSFIDVCCKSNPDRRFASLAQAIQSLPREGPTIGSGQSTSVAVLGSTVPHLPPSPVAATKAAVGVILGSRRRIRVPRAVIVGLLAIVVLGILARVGISLTHRAKPHIRFWRHGAQVSGPRL